MPLSTTIADQATSETAMMLRRFQRSASIDSGIPNDT
jgi:hypothetical protein